MNVLIQVVSLLGAVLILAAFLALQRAWWSSSSARYLWCNLVGSVLLTAVAAWDRRAGFVLLEGTWALVSAWSLISPRAVGRAE